MKIYKHEIGIDGRVVSKEINVKETAKTYKTTDWIYQTIINKRDVGILKYGRMYSLSPNPRDFLKAKIEAIEIDVERYEKMLADSKKRVEHIRALLAETESEAEKCND